MTTEIVATDVVLPGIVEPDGLQIRTRRVAPPTGREVLVRVEATGVSFAEQGMRRGRYPGQPKFPFVLGYDLVGRVEAVGPDADPALVGTRVAAVTKTGGWSTYCTVDHADLVAVPEDLDPAEVETLVVNGITAYQMLHRSAAVRSGGTILVHGASGGVGTVLVQLARHSGVRVIGTAAPRNHDLLRRLGAEPVDYTDPHLPERVRELAPGGVDAVFDHLGPDSASQSFTLLAPGGTLVAYGTATSLNNDDSVLGLFARMMGRIVYWKLMPNRRGATFYNFWAGHTVSRRRFRRRLNADLTAVLALLASGTLTAHIAARFPLTAAAEALTLAESRTTTGKVILEPNPGGSAGC